jgi:hypothetical protein
MYGGALGRFAEVLADVPAYEDFVGAAVAGDGASGMYYFDIDTREEQSMPAAFVRWDWHENYGRRALGAGSCSFRGEGTIEAWFIADTPVSFKKNTAGAKNWILDHAQAMVLGMEVLFNANGAPACLRHHMIEAPFRVEEKRRQDRVGVCIGFVVG